MILKTLNTQRMGKQLFLLRSFIFFCLYINCLSSVLYSYFETTRQQSLCVCPSFVESAQRKKQLSNLSACVQPACIIQVAYMLLNSVNGICRYFSLPLPGIRNTLLSGFPNPYLGLLSCRLGELYQTLTKLLRPPEMTLAYLKETIVSTVL